MLLHISSAGHGLPFITHQGGGDMYCYVKGCSKLLKAESPDLKVGFCDEHLDEAQKLVQEFIPKVNVLKIKLYDALRNLDNK